MIEDIDNYAETPRTKPVKAFKARVKVYDNDVVVVNPQEPRESNRKMIKQKGKSSFYKSEGEKESSYSIHINVDANDPDPVATMQEQFSELVKTTKTVVLKTTIPCGPTIERELLRLQSVMGSVIAQHYSEILKVFNSVKKEEPNLPSTQEIIDRI